MIRATLFRSAVLAGLLGAPMLAAPFPAAAFVSVGISIGIAPPPLPVYEQPFAPEPGYIWTPGYWAWDPAYGYYWVPGAWVLPPEVGLLWTPGWWGWDTGYYRWHQGYWGSRVGFYGGINYGFGYFGVGYVGGYWRGHDFYYNRAVNNINVTNVRNVYVDKTVVNNYPTGGAAQVSYNGGRGGITARPTSAQLAVANERHFDPTSSQTHQRELAVKSPAQRFSVNHGRPEIAAAPHPDNLAPTGHAMRNETMTAPRTSSTMTASHPSPSMARPSDGFVHAPHAATETAPRTAPMVTSHAAPTKQSSDGFVHAPHVDPTMSSHNEAMPPPRNEAMPSRNQTASSRENYERQTAPPQMQQHQEMQQHQAKSSMPQQEHAPTGHAESHKPPPKQDHQNDDGH